MRMKITCAVLIALSMSLVIMLDLETHRRRHAENDARSIYDSMQSVIKNTQGLCEDYNKLIAADDIRISTAYHLIKKPRPASLPYLNCVGIK
jgi:hypothetical protein